MSDFTEEEYQEAIQICIKAGRVSASAIQRTMRIGYIKASLLIEAMLERGIAERGEPNGYPVFIKGM